MDNLLLSLKEVSEIILPTLGALVLILVAIFLVHLIKTIKKLNASIEGIDAVIKDADGLIQNVDGKVTQLDGPLTTLNNVSTTVDTVNNSAVGAVHSAIKFSSQYSDSILNWFHDAKAKKSGSKDQTSNDDQSTENKEEDFGIYD